MEASAGTHLFTPRDTYRTRSRGRGGVGVSYLSPGAIISYSLAKDAEAVKIEILNGDGDVVRTFNSSRRNQRPRRDRPAGQGMRGPRRRRPAPRSVSRLAGTHRITWDMREAGERGRGPMALPGRYQVRLVADGETRTAPLQLIMDPRVAADDVTLQDLRDQRDLILNVQKLQADASALAARLRSKRAETEGDAPALSALEARVFTERGIAYATPMLLDQVRYLASMVDGADQKPGRDGLRRLQQLRDQVKELNDALDRLR